VDSETLSPEKIFPDNYTRREIMASKAKCPYVKEGCTSVLAVDEMEKHIHTEHCSAVNGTITTNVFNGSHGEHVVECDYKYVGCDIRVPQVELQRHLEADVHHHLQVLITCLLTILGHNYYELLRHSNYCMSLLNTVAPNCILQAQDLFLIKVKPGIPIGTS